MLIRNYGHLWERRFVYWGRGSNAGHLWGTKTPNDSGADFRDQIGIYILYDKDNNPVYVGQTGSGNQRLFSRLRQHTKDHLWNRWEYFSWYGFRRVNANAALSDYDKPEKIFKTKGDNLLNEIESALIVALEPKLNKQGPRWKDVDEYFQYVEEELEERSISEVLREFSELKEIINKKAKSK